MNTIRTPQPSDRLLDLLLEWVGSDDSGKIVPAVMLLCRIGPPVIEFLVAEAAKPSTSLIHQYRLLDLASTDRRPTRPNRKSPASRAATA